MPSLPSLVTAATINYQTPDLLEAAVRSFREVYPEIRLLVIDNGSKDASKDVIERLEAGSGGLITAVMLERNIFHGPAMHLAIGRCNTPFVYLFDSDTVTRRSGFLEGMTDVLQDAERDYGAGQVVRADHRGFRTEHGTPVLASAYMLLRRAMYERLSPFVHHGLPALANFQDAAKQGYRVHAFPVEAFVDHLGRGTAARFGYGLGLRSKMDYLLHRIGW